MSDSGVCPTGIVGFEFLHLKIFLPSPYLFYSRQKHIKGMGHFDKKRPVTYYGKTCHILEQCKKHNKFNTLK